MNDPSAASDNALRQISINYPGVSSNNIFPQVPIQPMSKVFTTWVGAPEEKSAQVLLWEK